ncbi:hypothetical protein D3C77_651800 [compost metagenome]
MIFELGQLVEVMNTNQIAVFLKAGSFVNASGVRKRGFPGYVASSLSLDGRPDDHAHLIEMIHHHVDSGRVVTN